MDNFWKVNWVVENFSHFSWRACLYGVITCLLVVCFIPATGLAVWDPPSPPPIQVEVEINTVTFWENQDDWGDAEPQLIWIVDAGIHGGATGSFYIDDLNADDFENEIAIWGIYENIWTHEECYRRSDVKIVTRLVEMDTIASDETLKWVVSVAYFLLTEGKLPPWAEKIPGIGILVEKLKDVTVEVIKEVAGWINSNDDLGEGEFTWGADGFYDIESIRVDGSIPATIRAGLKTNPIADPDKVKFCEDEVLPPIDIADVGITMDGPIDIIASIEPFAIADGISAYPVNARADDMFSMLKTAATIARTIEAEPGNPDQLTDKEVQDIRDTYIHIALGLAEVVSGTYVVAAKDFYGVQNAVHAFQKGRQLAVAGDIYGAIDAYGVAYYTALRAIESRVLGGTRLPFQVAVVTDFVSTEPEKRPLLLISVLGSDRPQIEISGLPAGVDVAVSQSDSTLGLFTVEMDIRSDADPGTYDVGIHASDGNREASRKLKLIINGSQEPEPPEEGMVFFDDFEPYVLGGLPANWDLVYNGLGNAHQVVSDAYSFSGNQSFQLRGRNGWSAVAQRSFETDAPLIGYHYKILIESYGNLHAEHAGFFKNHGESYWGTYYAVVRFDHISGQILAENGTVLGEWQPGFWYDVLVQLNRDEKTYSVWIDGNEVGTDLPIDADSPALIDAIALVSGHAGVRVFYDDVGVFIPASGGDIDSDGDGISDVDDLCPDMDFGLIDVNFDGCPDTPEDIAIFLGEEPVELTLNPDPGLTYILHWRNMSIYLDDLNLLKKLMELLQGIEDVRSDHDLDVREKGKWIRLFCKEAEIIARYALQEAIATQGADHPDVIKALKLFKEALEFIERGRYEESVEAFRQSVLALSGGPRPSLKVEIMPRWGWEADAETFAAVSEWVWLPIRVTNDGNMDLKNVSIDQSYSGFFETIDGLKAGETITMNDGLYLDCSLYRVKKSDPDPFLIITTANGWAGIVGAHQAVSGSVQCTVDIIHPKLGIFIKGPVTALVGEIISFEIEVVNQGDVPLYDILLEEHVYYRTLKLFIKIESLPPGESRFYHYHYYVTKDDGDSILVSLYGSARRPYDNGIDHQLVSRQVHAANSHRVKVIQPVVTPDNVVPVNPPIITPINPRPAPAKVPVPYIRMDSRYKFRTLFRRMRGWR